MSELRAVDALGAWASLKHGGLLLAPSRLSEVFPDTMPALPWKTSEHLRRAVIELNGDGRVPTALMDAVLEGVLALGVPLEPHTGKWLKGTALGVDWTRKSLSGEATKPQRVWQGEHGAELPVFVDTERRIGLGRGRRMPARVAEWLRATDRPLAVLTNGRQWRLIHAALDSEAFAEWDTNLWFEEGEPGPQVAALRALLDRERLTPTEVGAQSPLVAAISASRKGQGELSAILGERVRQAVELLIRRVFAEKNLPCELEPNQSTQQQIYRAATRVVMRMVVVLFAEARDDLLPRSNPIYHLSYGLQGLREALQQAGAGTKDGLARLAHRRSAWPRVLSLFRLIYLGSPHKDLTLRRYGGGLFEPGDAESSDTLRRALSEFENAARGPSDADVFRMLELLCVTETRMRQGTAFTRVPVPVDFSDLSSEYIGILYEGLLDYELRRANQGDPIVFLNLGDQPALPLSRLESMDDKALAGLVEKLKAKKKDAPEEDDSEDEVEGAEAEPDENSAAIDHGECENDAPEDSVREAEEQAHAWARRAVEAGKIVKKPKSSKKDALERHEAEVATAARALIARTVLPGDWFLVRWGGTRKGAGTFYTRPALAVPTAHRTLRPLAYDPPLTKERTRNEGAPASDWTPKKPEEILALKVCDPAMGSASFLVASLRFLTDALVASLHHHGRIAAQGETTLVTLAEGKPSKGRLVEEILPGRPDDENFQPRLRAVLKRYIVERCLYGVDIDPLAVELGRLALWVETLDRDLPFEFLDHKLKVGNSLIGCWFDRFRDYPVLAWEREGGDKGHNNGVHFEKGAWSRAIKQLRDGVMKRELVELIQGQITIEDTLAGRSPEELHDEALGAVEAMHQIPVHDSDTKASFYRDRLRDNGALNTLRAAFDAWCAVWFWPADQLDVAPTPKRFARPSEDQRAVISSLHQSLRFFHWELEFPDVFCRDRELDQGGDSPATSYSGFDAVIGNPPWEIQKPNSREYFSNLDPLYRTYGKQAAIRHQVELFTSDDAQEKRWLEYNALFKALSNWNKSVASPFGDGADEGEAFSLGTDSRALHAHWASRRAERHGYADRRHPFRHQGSADINTYKMFLEQGHGLAHASGQVGMIVPSGLYTDKGSAGIRALFVEKCQWQWLFGFENKQAIFDIHRSFKFCPVIIRKGGSTEAIRCAFMRHDVSDWADAERYVIPYAREQIVRFSPRTRAILEISQRRDLEVLEKIYANSVLLGDDSEDGWGIQYVREFDMTNDSHLFHPRPWWEERGYVSDEYGRWIKFKGKPNPTKKDPEVGWIHLRHGDGAVAQPDIDDIAFPLYQGVMLNQFDPSAKGWVSGTGLKAVWEEIPFSRKVYQPQFLLGEASLAASNKCRRELKVGFRDIARTTDKRTMISCLIPGFPCGNKVPVLTSAQHAAAPVIQTILNSYVFDWTDRTRQGGTSLNYFVIEEAPLLRHGAVRNLEWLGMRLSAAHLSFAPWWVRSSRSWWEEWAVSDHERLRLRCIADALIAYRAGLSFDDLGWILRACDLPTDQLRDQNLSRRFDPKGFWRVDRDKHPELRQTVLSLIAFRDLEQMIRDRNGTVESAIDEFVGAGFENGWSLPESLCLADYGLGHDDRAKNAQPVRSSFGDRLLPWQTARSAEDSWKEWEIHARNLLGSMDAAKLWIELGAPTEGRQPTHADSYPSDASTHAATALSATQGDLFGSKGRGDR